VRLLLYSCFVGSDSLSSSSIFVIIFVILTVIYRRKFHQGIPELWSNKCRRINLRKLPYKSR